MKFLFKVKQYIDSNRLIKSGDRILLAVSGGPDSMVLLYMMRALSSIMKFEIGVVHIDHKIRIDSYRDLKFVEAECRSLGLPFFGREICLFDGNKRDKRSLEQRAREYRYAAIMNIADEFGYNLVATGHTKSDQAETLLMRIIMGTNIRSLSGILTSRDGKIIRPLLVLERDEIMDCCREHNIKFVKDATNRDRRYLRNKVRLDLIPYIKKRFNPSIEDSLFFLAQDATGLRSLLMRNLSRYLKIIRFDEENSIVSFRQEDFRGIPEELRVYFLLEILEMVGVDRRIDFKNLRSAIDAIINSVGSRFYRLVSNIVIRCEYGKVSIGSVPDIHDIELNTSEYEPLVIRKYGRYKIGWADIELDVEKGVVETHNYPYAAFSIEKFGFPFTVRVFKEGDRIFSPYYKKDVKLKKIFINRKIPLRFRRILPVIISGDEILWVPGVLRSGIGSAEDNENNLTITVFNYEPELVEYLGPYDEKMVY